MRRGPLLFIIALIVTISSLAMAATAAVGPNDGMVVESLAPLDTPTIATVEKIADTSFPLALEKANDFPSAQLEWQRIAHESSGNDRLNALLHIAQLQGKLKQAEALRYTQNLLLKEYPTHPATAAALYQPLWQAALSSGTIPSSTLPQAQKLAQRLQAFPPLDKKKAQIAAALSLVPGAGHIYLRQEAKGAAIIILWAMFGLAFASACRHRHYAYAFVFVLPFVALWLNAPFLAMQQAEKNLQQQAEKTRRAAMAQWADLQPQDPLTALHP